ncbi:MAG: NaeI family type II restriction endonuclease [Verrucomicrobia bacterium]|nr:NaeI family type II restriction endonuclease [Verrucomicrobiota bacterium]
MPGAEDSIHHDPELTKVVEFFLQINGFEAQAAETLRRALDEVIDGMRTGRWSVNSLEKTEKTYIGTKVEILFKFDFELSKGNKLDIRVEDTEVDIKCTVLKDWMIPKEAVGELCLLVRIDDQRSKFWIGVIRAETSHLRSGENRDKKSSLSAEGKKSICWLIEAGDLPGNFIGSLAPEIRERIFSHKNGQARVKELFRLVQNRIIPRVAIETIAHQKDPMARARHSRKPLLAEGIIVLGHQENDPKIATRLGLPVPRKGEMISTLAPDWLEEFDVWKG